MTPLTQIQERLRRSDKSSPSDPRANGPSLSADIEARASHLRYVKFGNRSRLGPRHAPGMRFTSAGPNTPDPTTLT